jgi:branched-chain amino acid transport system permease protein
VTGSAIDRVVYFPLRKKKATNLVFLIASFGVFIFLQNLVQIFYGVETKSLRTRPVTEGFRVWGAAITGTQVLILFVSCLLSLALWLFIQRTKLGKAMRAVSDDPVAASIVGIYAERTIQASFFIGSVLAGAAGVLVSLDTNIEPTMGLNAILKGIIASIIGGAGSIPGVLLGALLLGLAENISAYWIPAGWKDCIAFAVLILFLLVKPTGVLGLRTVKEQL